jgi:hypothetical protein
VVHIQSFFKKVKKYVEFHNAIMKINIPFLFKMMLGIMKDKKAEKTGLQIFTAQLSIMEVSVLINKLILINNTKKD